MFDNKTDLMEFLLQCRKAKIKAIKVGEIQVEFSELAFVEDYPGAAEPLEQPTGQDHAQVTNEPEQTDDEVLFWSAKN